MSISTALRLLALPAALACLLVACDVVDPTMRRTCIAVLPAVEAEEARIVLLAAAAVAERPGEIRLTYRTSDRPGDHTLDCAFDRDAGRADPRALVAVRDDRGEMSGARLLMLRRFWLADPRTVAEALARVEIAADAKPGDLVATSARSPGAGRD